MTPEPAVNIIPDSARLAKPRDHTTDDVYPRNRRVESFPSAVGEDPDIRFEAVG